MQRNLSAEEMNELLEIFADAINYQSEDPCEPIDPFTYVEPCGDTCLHIAARRGNLRAVELLCKAGLDINRQGDMGYTPLHYASTPEIVSFLISQGASTDVKNEFGKSPIGWKDTE